MLYVGFLDAPFRQAKLDTLINIGVASLVLAALSVTLFLRWARSIFMPLAQMNATIGQVAKGDLRARTDLKPAGRSAERSGGQGGVWTGCSRGERVRHQKN